MGLPGDDDEVRGEPLPGEAVIVLSTAPAGEAETLARSLVDQRLAACVSVTPGVRSTYWWKGEVVMDTEALLLIKSTVERLAELRAAYLAAHSYEVPEFVVLRPELVEPAYLNWLREATLRARGQGE